ncbi:MAG: cytochrome c oxidase subunit II [Candidatus Binatia bacterium]
MRRSLHSVAALLFAACTGEQSVLAPRGPEAAVVSGLAVVLFAGGALIMLLVLALTVYAIAAPATRRRWLAGERVIVGGGIALPIGVLTGLLWYELVLTHSLRDSDQPPAVVIDVIGEQWWWRVHYPAAGDGAAFATANEIWLPAGVPVDLRLATADVIHSFWVPQLAGKLDMIPGRINRLRLRADVPGVYRGQCAEYCGGPHALMAFHVVVVSEPEFAAWRERQRAAAPPPADPFRARGRELFLAGGCGACHTVAGTAADGVIGPDLTHVGGRRQLAAGVLPNHTGTMAGWIAGSQRVKPGNRMPSFAVFQGVELRAMASWLASLE